MHHQTRANKDSIYLAVKECSTGLYINCINFEAFKDWLAERFIDD
jgi:hypothetical protein